MVGDEYFPVRTETRGDWSLTWSDPKYTHQLHNKHHHIPLTVINKFDENCRNLLRLSAQVERGEREII